MRYNTLRADYFKFCRLNAGLPFTRAILTQGITKPFRGGKKASIDIDLLYFYGKKLLWYNRTTQFNFCIKTCQFNL